MKKYIFTYNQMDGRVISYSIGLNEVSEKFKQIELEVTPEEYEMIQQNYELFTRNGKLVCEKSQRIIDDEKEKQIEKAKKVLQEKGDSISIKELSNLLLQIIG